MSQKLSAEGEMIAAYGTAMTAAFQVLIMCLQNNGTLERGEFQEALRTYMEISKHEVGNEIVLALLHDLRQRLLD